MSLPTQLFQTIACRDFDLQATLFSGQVFRWSARSERATTPSDRFAVPRRSLEFFEGWIYGSRARVSQMGESLLFGGVETEELRRFFSLNQDFTDIVDGIDVDPLIHDALKAHWGLRVIRQDPWESTAGFILSAFNNIVRLTGMLDTLAVRYGERAAGEPWPLKAIGGLSGHGSEGERGPTFSADGLAGAGKRPEKVTAPLLHKFPTPERLARVSEKDLRACGLGYRAPYLKAAARMYASGKIDPEKLKGLEDDALREALMEIPGIGEKVAECVMLFGYGRESAFPVDVWISRVMRRWYFRNRKIPDKKIREFARKHFGPYCGWAQQYLFHYARSARSERATTSSDRFAVPRLSQITSRQAIEPASTSPTRPG